MTRRAPDEGLRAIPSLSRRLSTREPALRRWRASEPRDASRDPATAQAIPRVRRRLVAAQLSSDGRARLPALLERHAGQAGSVLACARRPAGRDLRGVVQKPEGEIRRKALFQELNYRFVINLDLHREQ